MAQVKAGDLVKVHYTGKLTNGEQFDSSVGREPLEFTVGAGQMIKGFDVVFEDFFCSHIGSNIAIINSI